ncbi:hypothetical protein SAMN05421803_1511 [Nocardiopsis flavescens]|uniref:Uncharacterized protein n=1 Tax=Nocardiopsis flavescens TaxID=758803 RepID=A0A1M6WTX2_9ACTN|nr:hypothetical protein [Nocardiopsis flavescens]SHK97106.1 hypothetical protein SAMN05421803_1511 [Nocardiopsis flavescens]
MSSEYTPFPRFDDVPEGAPITLWAERCVWPGVVAVVTDDHMDVRTPYGAAHITRAEWSRFGVLPGDHDHRWAVECGIRRGYGARPEVESLPHVRPLVRHLWSVADLGIGLASVPEGEAAWFGDGTVSGLVVEPADAEVYIWSVTEGRITRDPVMPVVADILTAEGYTTSCHWPTALGDPTAVRVALPADNG